MAELKKITGDTIIVLDLKTTSESPEWIGYELKVLINENSELTEFLRLRYPECLFFENFVEPEVPALCNYLYSLVYGKVKNYTFALIDEKDFYLKISKNIDYYTVTLFFNSSAMILKTNACQARSMIGLSMNVSGEGIINFSRELKKQYEDMFVTKLLTCK